MEHKYHFITGLPRAGSTVLCNILNQNENFHVTATSPLCSVLAGVRELFWKMPETRAMPREAIAKNKIQQFQRGAFEAYFKGIEEDVIFDKARPWLHHAEIAKSILETPPKFVVCVRDLRGIFASFENLWRKTKDYRVIAQAQAKPIEYQTIDGRYGILFNKAGVIGGPIEWVKDAKVRGFMKNMLFVEYETLCAYPNDSLKEIYAFLEEEFFEHDFENIRQTIKENDTPYQWGDLHKIREGKLTASKVSWKEFLPANISKILKPDATFWKD
jgi:sulfotransferase